MQLQVAHRFGNVQSSPIREILAVASQPGMISFAGGVPDPNLFDIAPLRESFQRVLLDQPRRAFQYAETPGEPELRNQIATRLSRLFPSDPDHIQMTSGSQEGIFLAALSALNPGDAVLVEEPTYLAALQAFRLIGARPIGVPCDNDGILPDRLESLLVSTKAKVVYLIPNFQNPSGRTIPPQRRQDIAHVLSQASAVLIEDDPYGELSFDGSRRAPISSLPGMSENSILLNSMSKIISPGLRIGWVRAEGKLLNAVRTAKQGVSLQGSVLDQLAVADYLSTASLDQHIAVVSERYRERKDTMVRAIKQHVSVQHISDPAGGMFCWATLSSESANTTAMLPEAGKAGVAYVPGEHFYSTPTDRRSMRLSYVTNAPDVIEEGVCRLATIFG